MKQPLISIVIACRADAAYVWRCFDSLKACQYRPVEVVLVDDASDDDPFRFMKVLRSTDGPVVRTIRTAEPVGRGRAQALGAAEARGEILVFLDPRCSLPPDLLNSTAELLAGNPMTAIIPVTCRINEALWEADRRFLYWLDVDRDLDFHWREVGDTKPRLLPTCNPACTMMSAKLYRGTGGYGQINDSVLADNLKLAVDVYAAGGRVELDCGQRVGFMFRDHRNPKRFSVDQKLSMGKTFFGNRAGRLLEERLRRSDVDPGRVVVEPHMRRPEIERPRTPNEFFATFIDEHPVNREPAARRAAPKTAASVAAGNRSLGYRAIAFRETSLRVATTSARLLRHVDKRYARLITDAEDEVVGSDGGNTISVLESDGMFRLIGPSTGSFDSYDTAKRYLKQAIVDYFCRANSDLMWFHAGAVSSERGAFLFVGPHGSGKSTLILQLCRRGYRYLSDDVIPIDPGSGEVYPFPISPFVRPAPDSEVEPDRVLKLKTETTVLTSDVIAEGPVPATGVFMPRYVRGARPLVEAASKASGCLLLLQHCLNARQHGSDCIRLISEAFGSISFATVTFDDAAEAGEILSKQHS